MKSCTVAVASLLATAALAAHPHARVHKRAEDVVWVTDYDYVTEIVGLTTTIWVSSESQATPAPAPSSSTTTSSTQAPEIFQPKPTVAAPAPPAQVVVPSSSEAPAPTTTTTTSAYTPPAAPTTFATSTTTAAPAPAPPASSSSAAAPSSSAAPATAVAAAAAPSTASSDSSSGGQCSEGSPCAGDITYYDAGLGACGGTNVNSDKIVALPHGLMGTQSNGNPYCGKTITITCDATGKSTTATVVDKCMGCDGYSIDLSPGAFDELDSESVGRTTAHWYFN